MKSILIISFSKLHNDGRVIRQIDFLKKKYRITAVAFDGLPDPDVDLIKIDKPRLTLFRKLLLGLALLFRVHPLSYRLLHGNPGLRRRLAGRSFDLIIANDIESLPLAYDLDPKAKVLLDAHEYSPRHFEEKLSWRILFQPFNIHICRRYIPRVTSMITVGSGLAKEYKKHFGVDALILNNATWYHDLEPSLMLPDKIRMIHHGGAGASRRQDQMIDMMAHLDERFTLDLMLITPELASAKTKLYIEELKALAAHDPRIKFLSPIKNSEVVAFINQYDIGVHFLPPVNFNNANTLPNKLFEFIEARLGVAIGPSPEMAEIVNDYHIGVVAAEFTPKSLAKVLNGLTADDVRRFKTNAAVPAKELSAEVNREKLLNLIATILPE